jgi:hypothetical protein
MSGLGLSLSFYLTISLTMRDYFETLNLLNNRKYFTSTDRNLKKEIK